MINFPPPFSNFDQRNLNTESSIDRPRNTFGNLKDESPRLFHEFYLFVEKKISRKVSFQNLWKSHVNTGRYFELRFDCKCQLRLGFRRHSRYRRRRFTRILACPLITPTAALTTTPWNLNTKIHRNASGYFYGRLLYTSKCDRPKLS